jgi:hypothetical protein
MRARYGYIDVVRNSRRPARSHGHERPKGEAMTPTKWLLALTAALACWALLGVGAGPSSAHEGNPNYRSEVQTISPALQGLSVSILNFDDRVQLINQTGRTVTVTGYRDEPYVRVLADGTVQVNRRSPTTYLNEDRYAQVEVPAHADHEAAPEWRTVDRTASYEWHDHRVHWMARDRPPQVKDPAQRTRVFDWKVPIRVAGQPGVIRGELWWVPLPGDGFPLAAVLSLVAAIAIAAALVVVVRRRRRLAAGPAEEAW